MKETGVTGIIEAHACRAEHQEELLVDLDHRQGAGGRGMYQEVCDLWMLDKFPRGTYPPE
jgi:hypothetical protein